MQQPRFLSSLGLLPPRMGAPSRGAVRGVPRNEQYTAGFAPSAFELRFGELAIEEVPEHAALWQRIAGHSMPRKTPARSRGALPRPAAS